MTSFISEGGAADTPGNGIRFFDRHVILLVDDHEIVRHGIRGLVQRLLEGRGELEILEVSTFAAANTIVSARRQEIELVILDLSLLDATARDMAVHLESDWADLPVVVISATEDWSLVGRFVKAGVLGFVPKSSNVEVMKTALQIVFDGGCYFPSQISLALAEEGPEVSPADDQAEKTAASLPLVRLYPRQEEILRLMYKGHSNKEMAKILELSVGTVKNHVAAILHAFNVNSRSKAVKVAVEGGYVFSLPAGEDGPDSPVSPGK